MEQVTSRGYQAGNDFSMMIDLMNRVRPAEHINDYPGKVDLEELMASAVVRANTRLWFNKDNLIGWAFINRFHQFQWELDPRYEKTIGTEIVEWAQSRVRKRLSVEGTGTIHTNCREDYARKIEFLKQHGFSQMQDTTISMIRLLSESIPEPSLPPGFVIRPLSGEQEAEAVAAMHRAALGTEYMTTQNRLIIMRTSGYDLSLDLVVVAPDGSIAANCICSADQKTKRGLTDPVSTHPRFQRMGLSRALLLMGMKLLRERGMNTAHLGTSGDNIAMQKTAESVGFRIEYTTIWFSKDVD